MSARVEPLCAIDVKEVMMMSVTQLDLNCPCTVRLTFHVMSVWVPFIKFSDQRDMFGLGRVTNKISWSEIVFS